MTLAEILPTLQSLPRAEKVRAIQLLAGELANEEPQIATLPEDENAVALWSQYDALGAAETLLRMLEEAKGAT